ncbi:hypothetical protein ACOMHN_016442 [Nucella lapillus]
MSSPIAVHEELEGQDEKTSEEESGEGGGGGGAGGSGAGGAGQVCSKRRPVRSQRMQAYLQQQGEALPQKLRRCSFPGCLKTFSSNPGLRYHERTHLPTPSHFRCPHCSKEFKSHNGLKYHLQKTKCQETPVDASSSLHPPPPLPPPLSLPQAAQCRESSAPLPPAGSLPPPARSDEPDSLCGVWQQPEPHHWPEPRHRKMESCRKRMEQAARREDGEGEGRVPPACRPPPLARPPCSQAGPLLEFAHIATGPQSPLLRTLPVDWEHARLQKESESARDVVWPRAVWQCFMQGTKVCIGGEERSGQFQPVESLAGRHLHCHGPTLPPDLREPVPVCVLSRQQWPEREDRVELTMACESQQRSRLTASCPPAHPFFVRNKGWASCDCQRTREVYGLSTSRLETGDVCLPPSCSRPASATTHSQGTEVNSLEYSSVVALSEMAQKRSQEGSGGQQRTTTTTTTTPVSPDDGHAPRAKRPMNAFLLWSQTKRAEFIMKFPRTNNR